ncbi:hypothetical protein OGY61_13475 [Citrobacter sp. CK196]|uniref:hypothetical protein n=1 Tax=Citrobacter sp. CK196 TaxID=2985105 RepID=UPI0025766E26|nr:hypothetical protein [Citrobacter sp. CK196]MDM2986858.1 hypothetical protein [Citrobacter sp. CK196]
MNNKLTGLGANHPANGPLTIDRLTNARDVLQRNLQYSNGGSMDYIIADAVKAIDELLASRGTEPVFFIEVEGDDWIQAGRIPGSTFDFNELPDGIVNLYTAPPAPVVPKDGRDQFEEWMLNKWGRGRQEYDFAKGEFLHGENYADSYTRHMWKAWTASRAAMLQGGKS